MIRLQTPPAVWTQEQLTTFETLMQAVEAYELYAAALTRLGISSGVLIQRRNELRDHILNVLGPAFRDAP